VVIAASTGATSLARRTVLIAAAALRLAEVFLRDLQADWEQHGKEILEVMRKKHPEMYFQCMVKLALLQAAELDQHRPFERQYTPEEAIAKLEERVGHESRQLFGDFLRKVKRLERSSQQGSVATPSRHTDAVDDEGEE
jgi:hypothetical protein